MVPDSDSDDLAEVFQRVVPWARSLNLKASLSIDVLTGTDLLTMAGRASLDLALLRNRPLLLILPPPFNHGRTPADTWSAKMRDASALLTLAMRLAARRADRRGLAEHGWARPLLLILSPPCTMYSMLPWSFNHGRTPVDTWRAKMRDASALLSLWPCK